MRTIFQGQSRVEDAEEHESRLRDEEIDAYVHAYFEQYLAEEERLFADNDRQE